MWQGSGESEWLKEHVVAMAHFWKRREGFVKLGNRIKKRAKQPFCNFDSLFSIRIILF